MPTETDVKAFVAAFADHWNDAAGGFERVMYEGATLHVAGAREPLPYDQAARFVASVKKAIPDLSLRVTNWAARGDAVFTEWEMSGTIGGKKIAWHGINRNDLKGAKSLGAVSCWDRHALLEQLDPSIQPLDLGDTLARFATS